MTEASFRVPHHQERRESLPEKERWYQVPSLWIRQVDGVQTMYVTPELARELYAGAEPTEVADIDPAVQGELAALAPIGSYVIGRHEETPALVQLYIRTNTGVLNYGIVGRNPFGRKEVRSLSGMDPKEAAPISLEVVHAMPQAECDELTWATWANTVAHTELAIPDAFFDDPDVLRHYFYANNITPAQRHALQELYARERALWIISQQGDVRDRGALGRKTLLKELQSEAAMNQQKRVRPVLVHDFIMHAAASLMIRGKEAGVELPGFLRGKADEAAIVEEFGAIVFGFTQPYIFEIQQQFIQERGLSAVNATAIAGYLCSEFVRVNILPTGEYRYGNTKVVLELVERLKNTPPLWLVQLVEPFIFIHPDSPYNTACREQGLSIDEGKLDPNVGLKVLCEALPKDMYLGESHSSFTQPV